MKKKKAQKVELKEADSDGHISRVSRYSFGTGYLHDVMHDIERRKELKVTEKVQGVLKDVTPVDLDIFGYEEPFFELLDKVQNHLAFDDASRASSVGHVSIFQRGGISGMRFSMDDIINGIGEDPIEEFQPVKRSSEFYDDYDEDDDDDEDNEKVDNKNLPPPYVKITLTRTDEFVLYEQRSFTVSKQTKEAEEVEEDNKLYDFLTLGKGKVRRRTESEAQTRMILTKSRTTQTIPVLKDEKGTYVSYFEMFDTYKALEDPDSIRKSLNISHLYPDEQTEIIMALPEYEYQTSMLCRVLAGNEFESGQKRFRNMGLPDRLSGSAEFRYSLNMLFRILPVLGEERKAVSDISFCPANSDIFAVAYGIYSFSASTVPNSGAVGVWNIKNPRYPERSYYYEVPAVSVAFSPYIPNLLAVGLYDGGAEVRDITKPSDYEPIAVSRTRGGFEPAVAIRWVRQSDTGDANEIEPFLVLNQDASVIRYRVINSPFLMEFKQIHLIRVEGEPEGLPVKVAEEIDLQACRRPRGLNLIKHPVREDFFYVTTDEGCYYKCSINYQNQYLNLFKCHENSMNMMNFSPWSPKLFLTCGDDWCIRIWVEGIFKPLIKLQNECSPVYMARWSYTHSTIIIALNRKHLEIWDIRRNILQPVAIHELDSSFNTTFEFNKSGTCLVVGNERGTLLMYAIDDLPFPPHFQYDELEKAIYAAIATQPELIVELENVGFFGYPNKECRLPSEHP